MEAPQQQAWDCLTPEEQSSLTYKLVHGKSTWEVGEILKMTHYKYLELEKRAEKFFKLFADYYDKWPSLVRPGCPIQDKFRDYLFGSMLRRLPKDEAIIYAGDSAFQLESIKRAAIIRNMGILKESPHPWDKDLIALIMEFDRWNNYRILPRALQAPSAYKRRNNRRDKVYLRYLHRIPEFKIRALVNMYWSRGKKEKRWFFSMISSDVFPDDGYSVIPCKKLPEILEALTKLKVYVFEDEEDAELFGLKSNYFFENTTNSKSGLKFWKEYREITERAINYKEIHNLDFTCEVLDNAYELKRKKRRKPQI